MLIQRSGVLEILKMSEYTRTYRKAIIIMNTSVKERCCSGTGLIILCPSEKKRIKTKALEG